jgi:hypothetical protein
MNVGNQLMAGRPGIGVIIRLGRYWYPARLIEPHNFTDYDSDEGTAGRQWTVVFWRGCIFSQEAVSKVGSLTNARVVVEEKNIADELWDDLVGRRSKQVNYQYSFGEKCMHLLMNIYQLGKWILASTQDDEDTLISGRPHEEDPLVNAALGPHVRDLEIILTIPKPAGIYSPVLEWSNTSTLGQKNQQGTPYACTGPLSNFALARIEGWLITCCPRYNDSRSKHRKELCRTHARTLYIALAYQKTILSLPSAPSPTGNNKQELDAFVMDEAWRHLVGEIETPGFHEKKNVVDVDRYAISSLEHGMFLKTKFAGLAGAEQWGAASDGPHQDEWDPYEHICDEWKDWDVIDRP